MAQHAQRRQPVHVGQVVVQQHQVQVGVRVGMRKGPRAGWRVQHLHGLVQAFEHLAQALAHQGMVVNDEDFQNSRQVVKSRATQMHKKARLKRSARRPPQCTRH